VNRRQGNPKSPTARAGDHDTNLQEYLNGQNPTVIEIGPMSIWTAVEIGWRSVSGTNYQVQWGDDD
jgi:hypothetical protein